MEALSPGSTPGSRAAAAAFLATHQNIEEYDITAIWDKRVYGACRGGGRERESEWRMAVVVCVWYDAMDGWMGKQAP